MSTELTKATPGLPGIAEERDECLELIRWFYGQIDTDTGKDELPRLPTKDERAAMQDAVRKLAAKVRPVMSTMTDKEAAMRAISAMLGRFPQLQRDNIDVPGMLSAYLLDLQGLPLFAIEAACIDVRKGKVKGLDPGWPPASPVIYKLAENYAAAVTADLVSAERVLKICRVKPKPLPPAQQEKLAQTMREFVDRRKAEHENDYRDAVKKAMPSIERANNRTMAKEFERYGDEPKVGKGGIVVSPMLRELVEAKTGRRSRDRHEDEDED